MLGAQARHRVLSALNAMSNLPRFTHAAGMALRAGGEQLVGSQHESPNAAPEAIDLGEQSQPGTSPFSAR